MLAERERAVMAKKKGLRRRREDLCWGSITLARVQRHIMQGAGRTMDPRYVAATKEALRIVDGAWKELEEDDRLLRLDEAAR